MRAILAILAFTAFALAARAQQTINDPNAQVRTVGSFTSISVSSGINLYLTPGDSEAVVVSAEEDKYRDKIITEVKDGVLRIYYDWKSNIRIGMKGPRKLKAYVSYKTLQKLSGSGGSDIYITNGSIQQNSLALHMSGGSDFKGRVEVQQLSIDLSGGSDADISGSATKADVHVSGGSDVNSYDLMVEECTVNASGGSDVSLTVSKKLVANASGGSDVHYKGNCELSKNASGGGEVKKKG